MIMNIRCLFIRPLIERFVDAELPPRAERGVRDHLLRCERCKEEVRLLFAIRSAVQLLPAPVPEERFWSELWQGVASKLETLRDVKPIRVTAGFFARNRIAFTGALAALAVLAVLGGTLAAGAARQQPRSVVPYIDYHVSQTDQRVLLESQFSGSQYLMVSYHGQ